MRREDHLGTAVVDDIGCQFILGPIPLDRYAEASKLPGAAGVVWMLALHRTRITGHAEVHIPRRLLELFAISHSVAARAYHALEAAGLVTAVREPGCAVRLRLNERGRAAS
jgi:hypothetical protein